jgi:hypothetical protein
MNHDDASKLSDQLTEKLVGSINEFVEAEPCVNDDPRINGGQKAYASTAVPPRPSCAWRGPAGLTTRLDWHADEAEGLVVGACRLARPALLPSLAGRVDRQAVLPVDQ